MKDESLFFNPFRMMSPKLDAEASRAEQWREHPASAPASLQQGLVIMISRAIEITKLLSQCVLSGSSAQMDESDRLAWELHQQEQILTTQMLQSEIRGPVLKGLIRFPYRLERVGDMLENMLKCTRVKARDGIPFSDSAHADLDRSFELLLEIMQLTRDVLISPNKAGLEDIRSRTATLAKTLVDLRLTHWERVEAGFCAMQACSMYLDFLDSIKSINEYLDKIAATFLEIGALS